MNALTTLRIYRPMVPVAVAFMAGIGAGAWWPGRVLWVAGAMLAGAGVMIGSIRVARARLFGPLLVIGLAGYLSIQPWLIDKAPAGHVSRYIGEQYRRIHGVIVDRPCLEQHGWRFIMAVDGLDIDGRRVPVSGRLMVSGQGDWPGAGRGGRVAFTGRLRAVRNFANPGGFDYRRYLSLQGIRARAYVKKGSLKVAPVPNSGGWQGRLDRAREKLGGRMAIALARFPLPTIQLLKALLLGEREQISNDMRQDFNRAGVGHVLAISGLHIGMVAAVSFKTAKWLLAWIPLMLRYAATRKGAALISLGPVLGYGLLAGLTPSTQRAMLMVTVFLMGFWVGRRHDWLNTLALAALVILLVHPPALVSISFQLSFMAVLAILTGLNQQASASSPSQAPFWQSGLRRLAAFIKVSILAVLGTLPLVLHYFNQISLVGVAVNIVVVPVVGMVVVPAGLAGVAAASLNGDLAALLWQVSALGAEVVRICVIWAAQWPWSAVRWVTPNGFEIALYYLLAAVVIHHKRLSRPGVALAAVLILIIADGGYWCYQRFFRRDLRVTAIDVGQGTANLIEYPGGYTALVDGGGFSGNSAFDVGQAIVGPLLWRRKINTVDLVVLSHPNSDHINGLLFILDHFHVKEVWSNGESCATMGYKTWRRRLAQCRVNHRDIGQIPTPFVRHGVSMAVLAPPEGFMQRAEIEPWRDLNNNSLVLRVSYGKVSFLFTGDIMAQAEAALTASRERRQLASTILFVPHHGSKHSSTPAFLEAVRPKEALISAGWRNRFGFPHSGVLRRLEKMGIRTWCTADDGAISIVTDGRSYRIRKYRP